MAMLQGVRGVCITVFVLVSGAALCAPEKAAPPVGDAAANGDPAAAAPKQVYKSVDANGNVIFTDNPPAGKSSEAVIVQPANSIPLGTSIAPQQKGETGDGEVKKKVVADYTRLEVTSPTNDEVMGQDVESATIAAVLEPGLQDGHTVQLYFDGKPVGNGSLSYTVSPLERGTHTAQAKVFNDKGKVIKSSNSVQFHVRRTSSLNKVSGKDVVPPKPTGLLATLFGRGQPKPPAEPPSGFGSIKGFGSLGGSGATGDAKNAGGIQSAADARSTKGAL